MTKIIIFGTGDFAEVAHFYLTKDSPYEVVGFTVNEKSIHSESFHNLPVIPFETIEIKYPPEKFSLFIAVGYSKVNKIRTQLYSEAKAKGYNLISYVNSKALVWDDLEIGDNCFILENVVIQPFVKIGNNVIIWSGNHIGHHTIIKDNCFITSHVVISGNVTIEQSCFLGVNSTIRDGIIIAENCIIGAGSVILNDTDPGQVFVNHTTKLLTKNSKNIKNI